MTKTLRLAINKHLFACLTEPAAQLVMLIGVIVQWFISFRMITGANTVDISDITQKIVSEPIDAETGALIINSLSNVIGSIVAVFFISFAGFALIITIRSRADIWKKAVWKKTLSPTVMRCATNEAVAILMNIALAYGISHENVSAPSMISNIIVIIAVLLNICLNMTCLHLIRNHAETR